jgi:ribonuclease HI
MTVDDVPMVRLYTDGACIGNPGPGGWGFILRHPASGRTKEASGGEHATTNNRMEITAVIRGLEALKGPSRVELFSDSQYVIRAIREWMPRWKRFGWRKSPKALEQVKNADLWSRLDELLAQHTVMCQWVRGHNGHAENERCDRLATSAAARVAKDPPPVTPVAVPAAAGGEAPPGLFAQGKVR